MTTPEYDIVVIGGGLSGLSCAYTLLKEGYSVCVLEQGHIVGGAFQSFNRRGVRFDTGFHYVGGVRKGEMMYPLISYFGLDNLPWKRLSDECFLELSVRGRMFRLRNGFDNFRNDLVREFPDEADGIDAVIAVLRDISEHMYDSLALDWNIIESDWFTTSAYEFLQEHIKSQLLRDVLCAGAFTTELTETLPLYSFAQSLASFIQGSYRMSGGGQRIADTLASEIEALGGTIITCTKVSSFALSSDGRIEAAICGRKRFTAKQFVSTIHPTLTIGLIPETPFVRKIYRKRMAALKNSVGMFTTHLLIRKDTIPYRNCMLAIHGSDDLWHNSFEAQDPVREMLVNFNLQEREEPFVRDIDLLTPMSWDAVKEWADTVRGHRPESYEEFKQKKARESIALAEQYIPQLEENIERIWTSTPLTYRDYTGTVEGSAFGVRKSSKNLMGTMLSPLTPIDNLFISGQSMTLHGMLGTMMSSIRTCSMICKKRIL